MQGSQARHDPQAVLHPRSDSCADSRSDPRSHSRSDSGTDARSDVAAHPRADHAAHAGSDDRAHAGADSRSDPRSHSRSHSRADPRTDTGRHSRAGHTVPLAHARSGTSRLDRVVSTGRRRGDRPATLGFLGRIGAGQPRCRRRDAARRVERDAARRVERGRCAATGWSRSFRDGRRVAG